MHHPKHRESWKSKIGFIFAALGSAIGLGSIWRFPYIVGENGGAMFILLYLFFLVLIGFPILTAEILIGRKTQMNPYGAFDQIGKRRLWRFFGKMTIVTGFLISSFYSVIAGWALGYLCEAFTGKLVSVSNAAQAAHLFTTWSQTPQWSLGFHFLFMVLSVYVLLSGVRKGIESKSKIFMPLLFLILLFLVFKGLSFPNSHLGLNFLFSPDLNELTPKAVIMALGQAFFTLSLGQGTMITYGSYLTKKVDVSSSCLPVVLLNTLISILVGIAIFTIVFSVGLLPTSGPSLIFETLPIVFAETSGGWFLSILFFSLVVLAALTSEISALEPAISYLIDEKKWPRKKASITVGAGAFILGIPTSLSFIYPDKISFYEIISFVSVNLLVPVGGLVALLLIIYKWGIKPALKELRPKMSRGYQLYFFVSWKYIAPILIGLILLDLLIFA
jgi:neurotransmitter:Na+ symporter, NSS family